MPTDAITAPVFQIQRASLHDGPGIRTVVYLQGCPLRCLWCHNPEGLAGRPVVQFQESRCIGCGRCLQTCRNHAIAADGSHVFRREDCTGCGRCTDACPAEALTLSGRVRTVQEVYGQIVRDRHYFMIGGGVTFSGGECLLHPAFVAQTAQLCRAAGISTCIESCFAVPWASVEMVLPHLDHLIVDLKHPDDETHRRLTGQGNARILQNLAQASQLHKDILVRIPLIPGCNDSDEELAASARLLAGMGEGIRGVELLKYNNLGSSKYENLGMEARLFGEPQTDEQMECKRAVLRAVLPQRITVVE